MKPYVRLPRSRKCVRQRSSQRGVVLHFSMRSTLVAWRIPRGPPCLLPPAILHTTSSGLLTGQTVHNAGCCSRQPGGDHKKCVCPRRPEGCRSHSDGGSQSQPSHPHGQCGQRVRRRFLVLGPGETPEQGFHGGEHPGVVTLCVVHRCETWFGGHGGTWDPRTAREPAKHIEGRGSKGWCPRVAALPPTSSR